MIRRRSATEPTIGHKKSDGKFGHNCSKVRSVMPCVPFYVALDVTCA
jgi:hypothetical protein